MRTLCSLWRKPSGSRLPSACSPACPNGVWPEVVAEGDRLGEVFVEVERAGDGAPDLRDFERVCETRDVVVAGRGDEHLRLVLEPPKRLAVDDAVAVPLILGAHVGRRLRPCASARLDDAHRAGREELLSLFEARAHCFMGKHQPRL